MTQYIKKLPAVFQTVTEKKFFDATFDQVFSKKDSDLLYGYLGQRIPGQYDPVSDFYLPEPSKDRTWWQLEATAFARNADSTKSNIFFYDDLLNRINYYGGNTLNQDRLFESDYYSWAPPIDYDMFINYQNYYWIDKGLVTISITGMTDLEIAAIVGQSSFTTPLSATPANLTFTTGLNVQFVGSAAYPTPLTVENVGCREYPSSAINITGGIRLVPQFPDYTAGTVLEYLPWDGAIQLANGRIIQNTNWDTLTWDAEAQPGNGDYLTIERGSVDENAWSRTNNWYHIDAINTTVTVTGTPFPANASRALRPIIQFLADLILYNSGTQFKADINYGFRNDATGSPILMSNLSGKTQTFIEVTYGAEILDGQLVVFLNDPASKQLILQSNVDTITSIVTFVQVGATVINGDIIFAINTAPYDGIIRGETWYYDVASWARAANDKVTVNQAPLFQLYDHAGVPLDNVQKYPGSTFVGSEIFSYKINTAPGATIDPVLKFPIVYTSLGQSTDIMFRNNLITDRYTYGSSLLPISGYYYYQTTDSPILYNNWNIYTPGICGNNQPPSPSKQRVIDKFVVGYGTLYQFKLSVTPYGYPMTPDIIVSVNGIEIKNAAQQTNGYVLTVINGSIYVDLQDYLTALLTVTQPQPPVAEVDTYTHGLLDPAANGYFEIPQQLNANPVQEEVGEISASNLVQQFSSIIGAQTTFTGSAFGDNNYRDTTKNRSVGSFILQNVAPTLKSMLISSSDDLDFIAGERFSQDEYTKFKNKYLKTAKQLIDQEFSPVQYHNNTIVISAWVDAIIKTVNISKEFSSAFAYSYMIANGTPYLSESQAVPPGGSVTLSNYVDLSNPQNALYVYDTAGQETLLMVGIDYEIMSTNLTIDIQFSPALVGESVYIALYKNPLPAYIPSTPTKIGSYGTFIPRKELDTSYTIPTYVIIGHDGSKTIAYGDYRDDLLLELEKRIYNLLQFKFRNEYYLPLRLESVKSGYYRQTRYTRAEYLEITESYLNKWSAKNRANYRVNDWATASADLPLNSPELWKLYNYATAVTPTGVHLNLPGNWKGIFQYYYDTIFPDTRPWEMLGFTSMPVWWIAQYGATWGSANTALWADLEAGIIRQGPSAIIDPFTLQPQPQAMWARPGLSAHIPVDTLGQIIPVPTLFNVAVATPYAPFDGFDNPWVYGDGGPVEQAWMSTSGYAFSIQEFLYLMKPGPFGELFFDTVGTELSPGIIGTEMSNVNWQYVQNDTYTSADPLFAWMRPKNADQFVHGETVDGVVQIRYGYQRWISDRILFLGSNVGTVFGQKVRTLGVNLANKLAGFTNKDTTTTYIESISTNASTTSLLVPTNNFDVILHTGQPIKTYIYSGVVIRILADGTFVVYGYDLQNSAFTVLDRSNAQAIDITVGGTPAEFRIYTLGETYTPGEIVRYNGVYYTSVGTIVAGKFNSANWQKLRALPTVGGVSVVYYPISEITYKTVPYGSILTSAQEVFDLLIGWGAYLETQGWEFTDVSADTNQVSDWLYSAKQFLFWLNTNWAPDASIQLSPAANNVKLTVQGGYPDDVETISNGVYSIMDKYGVAMPPNSTSTERDGMSITVSPVDLSVGGIYFLQVHASETEHILIFDNTTSFSDIIYDPLLQVRQQRLRFNGARSNGWYGKKEAPGYLIMDNQLVPNYDTIVDSMRYYYDPDITIDNPSLEALGRHLIGYESKSYLDNLQLSNDTQYLFYQGAIRQKGTIQSLDKLFRSTKVQSNEIIEVYEEWALKLADFGNTIEQVSTEFILKPEQNTGEVIVARLNFIPSPIGFVKSINIVNAENTYLTVPDIIISPPDVGLDGFDISAWDEAGWDSSLSVIQAKAYAVLDSIGRISRIDISNPGYGYLTAPIVTISSGSESHELDRLYAVWQGAIYKDTALDNIIEIDIDDTNVWTVRPSNPSYSLEFPTTDVIEYSTPNAGYVNFNDVDLTSFDVTQTTARWGTPGFNPVEHNTIWVAKTFTEDWCVYKMVNINAPLANFEGFIKLVTPLLPALPYTELTVTSLTSGTISLGNFIKGNNVSAGTYITSFISGTGGVGTYALNIDQVVADIIAPVSMVADDWATVQDPAGNLILLTDPSITLVPQLSATPGTSTDFGNLICLQIVATDGSIAGDTNYTAGFEEYGFPLDYVGYNSYSLMKLDGTPVAATDMGVYADFTTLLLFKTMRFNTTPSLPSYVTGGDKIWVDDVNGLWTVFNYTTSLTAFRVQENLIDSKLFENAQVFQTRTQTELVLLPIYDPFKSILPALAKQNITYMLLQDPARYNVTGNTRLFSENITFGEAQVGKLWWDLSSVRYTYYEQPIALDGSESPTDNLVYRRNRWGQIFPGSTINIYEWKKSPVPPSQYTGSGTPRDITTYVQIMTSNKFTNITEINYYFWVLNPTDKPNIENRTMAALEVSRLLATPKSQNFAFFCPVQQTANNNSYLFYNVQEILAYRGDNVQIQYRLTNSVITPKWQMPDRNDQIHAQWKFFREGDTASLVTDRFWDKMVDSLCAYTKLLPFSSEWANGILIANNLPWNVFEWNITGWNTATSTTTAEYGYVLPVPDPSLGEAEKYGIEYRPRQGMFKDVYAARKVFVQAGNNLLKYIPIRDNNAAWDEFVPTSVYWTYTNWYAVGYEDATPTVVFSTLSDAQAALVANRLANGTIVEIVNGTVDGRFVLYAVVQLNPNTQVQSFQKVGIEASAIMLLDTIYTTKNIYGLSVELRELLNAFRTEVMVNNYIVDQNELYFSMLNYVLSEQKNPDWTFKTSYIYIKENNIPLSQSTLYMPDQIGNIISYITDVKPYHTQIRDYTSTHLSSDIAIGTAIDSMKSKTVLTFGPYYSGSYNPTPNLLDPYGNVYGWDVLSANSPTRNWDSNEGTDNAPWVYDPTTNTYNFPWDTTSTVDLVNQFVSYNPVLPAFNPGLGPWPDLTPVPLTIYDPSKRGYSELFPYTFNITTLDDPQSLIIPENIVFVKLGETVLIYGRDYYAGYNTDGTYTVYFYNDPTPITPVAYILFDGGSLMEMKYDSNRNELAIGYGIDDFVVNVDTQLYGNDISSISALAPATSAPYVAWGEVWNSIGDPIVADAILVAGGTIEIPWNIPLVPVNLGNTISFKENLNINTGADFYRNNAAFEGTLTTELPSPSPYTFDPLTNVSTPNTLDIIIVFVDPLTHPATTDILPEPMNGHMPAIWINGERIEYGNKVQIAANTWQLSSIYRGTQGTTPNKHLANSSIWVEENNILPPAANENVWNASNSAPLNAENITSVPAGGLWYAQTNEAIFLKTAKGKAINP